MSETRNYVPILHTKGGEFRAIKELRASTRTSLTPFFDVIDVPWDHKEDRARKSVEDHLDRIADATTASWGTTSRVYFDTSDMPLATRTSAGSHPMAHLFRQLRKHGVKGVPVVGLDRDDAYVTAVKQVSAEDERGACIRLQREDLEDLSSLRAVLPTLLARLSLSFAETDLLLDLRNVTADELPTATLLVVRSLKAMPGLACWRTLTLAASGFPESLAGIKADSVDRIRRCEFDLWESVAANQSIARKPDFGDYAIAHPDFLDIDHRKITLSANIRYSLDREWLILRGRSFKRSDYAQFHELSRNLVVLPEYYGAAFSWGDAYISQNAVETVGPGNLEIWRGVGTNHHLALVTRQIATSAAT